MTSARRAALSLVLLLAAPALAQQSGPYYAPRSYTAPQQPRPFVPAPQSRGQPTVEVAVQVIEVQPNASDKGFVARLEADVRRMLHRSHRVLLRQNQYHLALGQTVHILLPNGCEAALSPTALEANNFVRMHLNVKAQTQFDLDLSVKSGGSFNVGAGRSTKGHLLLMISPHGEGPPTR